MPVRLVGFLGEPVIVHDLPTHKAFEGQGSEHVEAKAEAGDIDDYIIRREVVEDVAFGHGAEGDEAGEGHGKACEHADGGTVVGY